MCIQASSHALHPLWAWNFTENVCALLGPMKRFNLDNLGCNRYNIIQAAETDGKNPSHVHGSVILVWTIDESVILYH